jgi:hypothetical protein
MLTNLTNIRSDHERIKYIQKIMPKLTNVKPSEFLSALNAYDNDHGRNQMASMILGKVQEVDRWLIKFLQKFDSPIEKRIFLQAYCKEGHFINPIDLYPIKSMGISNLDFLKINPGKVPIEDFLKMLGNIDDCAKYRALHDNKDVIDTKNIDRAFLDFKDDKIVYQILCLFDSGQPLNQKSPTFTVNGVQFPVARGTKETFKTKSGELTISCVSEFSHSVIFKEVTCGSSYENIDISGERFILTSCGLLMIERNIGISPNSIHDLWEKVETSAPTQKQFDNVNEQKQTVNNVNEQKQKVNNVNEQKQTVDNLTEQKICIAEFIKTLSFIDDTLKYEAVLQNKHKLLVTNIDRSFETFTNVQIVVKILELFGVDKYVQGDDRTLTINGNKIDLTNGIDLTRILNQGNRLSISGNGKSYSIDLNGSAQKNVDIRGERFILMSNGFLMMKKDAVITKSRNKSIHCGLMIYRTQCDKSAEIQIKEWTMKTSELSQQIQQTTAPYCDQSIAKHVEPSDRVTSPALSMQSPEDKPLKLYLANCNKELNLAGKINYNLTTDYGYWVSVIGTNGICNVKLYGHNNSVTSISMLDLRGEKVHCNKTCVILEKSNIELLCS